MKIWLHFLCGVFAVCCLSCGNKTGTGDQDNQPPRAPVIYGLAASNGATNVPIDTKLQWVCFDPDGDPLFYDVYFGTDSVPAAVKTNIVTTAYSPGTLAFKTTYFWRIVAKDQFGNSTSSPTWSFTTTASAVDFTLNPTSFTFGATESSKSLTISVANDSTLTWSLAPSQSWLSVSPASGSTTTSTTVTVTVSRSGLADGLYNGILEFSSNGGNASIAVDMTVGNGPALSLTKDTLNFGSDLSVLGFQVDNLGSGTLSWSAQPTESWLSASPASGTTNTETDSVSVLVNRTGMGDGNFTGYLIVSSNGGTDTVVVLANNGTPGGDPLMEVIPDTLRFALSETSKSFSINNVGGGTLSWSASDTRSWLTFSPTSGTTTTETDQVVVTVNRSGLTNSSYTGLITINSNGGRKNVVVIVTVTTGTPVLVVEPGSIALGSSLTQGTITVRNAGSGTLTWTASDNANWLSVSPSTGSSQGETDQITVTATRNGASPGSYEGLVVVSSNAGRDSVFITMSVDATPVLSVSPNSLDFGANETSMTLQIENVGSGNLNWVLNEAAPWLSVSPTSGSTTTETDNVTVSVTRAGFGAGSYTSAISVTSNGGTETITVTMNIDSDPSISVSRTSMNFGESQSTDSFFIANSGTGTLTWTLSTNQDWLSASPTSGSSTGEPDRVVVSVNRDGLSSGDHNGEVRITSNGGNATVRVTVSVPSSPALGTSVESINFGPSDNVTLFSINNVGSGTLTWSLTADQPWLIVLPTSGSTTSSDQVSVSVVRLGLSSGDHTANITITSNGGNKTIPVTVSVAAPPNLGVAPTSVDFGAEDTMRSLLIENLGGGTLSWSIATSESWLSAKPEAGTTATETDRIELKVQRKNMDPGTYAATALVNSNGGNASVAVTMTVIQGVGGN